MSVVAQPGQPPDGTSPDGPLLDVEGLRVQYGGVIAIDAMTFQIPHGLGRQRNRCVSEDR